MRVEIPKLRMWHLIGLVAASACFIAVLQFRTETEDPGYLWMRRLRSLDAAERAEAAQELGRLRPPERRAIAPLTEALYDGDAKVRAAAAWTLGSILNGDKDDPEAGTVKAVLASSLRDPDPAARLPIVQALAGFHPEPDVVVPSLLEFTSSDDARARFSAINQLGWYARESEPARSAVFAGLVDPDPTVRYESVHMLSACATIPDLAPVPLLRQIEASLLKMAGDPAPIVRSAAVSALGGLGSQTRTEFPVVIEALADPDADVRLQAALHLAWRKPGVRSPALLPSLARSLKDPDARVRMAASKTLGWLGLEAEATLLALRALAGDPENFVREAATAAISSIEKAADKLRSTILTGIANLGDADPDVRALGADQLGDCGPRAAEAAPALARCLDDREALVRLSAARALGQLGPAAVVALPDLARRAGSDDDERVRGASAISRSILARDPGVNSSP